MEVENFMLSEINQSKKTSGGMFSLLCGLEQNKEWGKEWTSRREDSGRGGAEQ